METTGPAVAVTCRPISGSLKRGPGRVYQTSGISCFSWDVRHSFIRSFSRVLVRPGCWVRRSPSGPSALRRPRPGPRHVIRSSCPTRFTPRSRSPIPCRAIRLLTQSPSQPRAPLANLSHALPNHAGPLRALSPPARDLVPRARRAGPLRGGDPVARTRPDNQDARGGPGGVVLGGRPWRPSALPLGRPYLASRAPSCES